MIKMIKKIINITLQIINKLKRTRIYLAIVIVVVLVLSYLIFKEIQKQKYLSSLEQVKTLSSEQALKDPNLAKVNHLVEFPKSKSVIVGVIKDPKALESKNSQPTFRGQTILIFDDLTIVYDPLVDTVVDIKKGRGF